MADTASRNPNIATDLEKRIYNAYLIQSRVSQGKAFQIRKNFNNFEEHPQYIFIKRVANFMIRYPDINLNEYFAAPYKVYPDQGYFDFKFFASPKGIKAYSTYKMMLERDSPDARVDKVKESLGFITKFCQEHRISVWDYPHYTFSGNWPEWIYHIKRNRIDPYTIMGFTDISVIIAVIPDDEKEVLLGDFGQNFATHRHNYISSRILRPLLTTALPKIQDFLQANKA